jgi:hypothetical protein
MQESSDLTGRAHLLDQNQSDSGSCFGDSE